MEDFEQLECIGAGFFAEVFKVSHATICSNYYNKLYWLLSKQCTYHNVCMKTHLEEVPILGSSYTN